MDKQGYEIIRIADDAWRIEEGGVRCYLFTGRETALLVDSGFGTGDLRAVVEQVTTLPVTVVNTHADRDHIGANRQFDRVLMHADELARYAEVSGGLPVAGTLADGDMLELGTRRFEVLHIPGHTPGHIALLDAESRVLLSGDSAVAGGFFMFGEGRDLRRYRASVQRLLAMRDRFDTLYPCHYAFPLPASHLEHMLAGVNELLDGSPVYSTRELHGTTIRVVDTGTVQFLLPPEASKN